MADHVEYPPELNDGGQKCDCCGSQVRKRRQLWLAGPAHHGTWVCNQCFLIWYDPNWADPTNPAEVKAERIARFGDGDPETVGGLFGPIEKERPRDEARSAFYAAVGRATDG